jgi:hypothetical protein
VWLDGLRHQGRSIALAAGRPAESRDIAPPAQRLLASIRCIFMSITVQSFDPDRIAKASRLFCDEVDDLWIMFHGTSGFNAKSIERDGLIFQDGFISPAEIRRVTAVYDRMRWGGESSGGFPILKNFSLDHDYLDNGKGILFFAETSLRALLYATRDFAGGEKLRALRNALHDLDLYFAQSDVRERHAARMNQEFRILSNLNAHPSMLDAARPVKVDLAWLESEISNLAEIRRLADSAYLRHDHGVVYALRMGTNDLGGLSYNSWMGIKATTLVPVS